MGRAGTILLIISLALSACGGESTPVSATPSAAASDEATTRPTPTPTPTATPEPRSAFASAWIDVTSEEMASVGRWTNKVELADLDGDGHVDILFANGGDYDTPGVPVASVAWLNNGDATFRDATAEVLGEHELLTRVIKVADVNADGFPDIFMGTTYDSQSRLLLGAAEGEWTDVTDTHLPEALLSVGDAEFGDVDLDGDLDLVLADWGDGSPLTAEGRMQLWLNDGSGAFTDATEERMPETLVGFSWDIELVDIDNDWDLDLAISCKACTTSLMFLNDGAGTFSDVTESHLPPFGNNYEFAPIDLDGDGFLDLVTINTGPDAGRGLTEHVLRNDGTGRFEDWTERWWPAEHNIGWDDNMVVALDVDSDGDADFLIGSLDGPDRLLINDGSGRLTVALDVFEESNQSWGTLDMGVADLDGDGRPDVVMAQGETSEDDRVYLAAEGVLEPDSAPPVIRPEVIGTVVRARVHDNRTPNRAHDWQSVTVRWDGGEAPMTWYGENLFHATLPEGASGVVVCAVDAVGNAACDD